MLRRKRRARSANKPANASRTRNTGGQGDFALGGPAIAAHGGERGRGRRTGLDARLEVCAICNREPHGFGYCHSLRWDCFPYYRFCSMACLDLGQALASGNFGVIDKSERERQAIKDARRNLAETLKELGLMKPFYDRTAADIDRIIEACVDGFRYSMLNQKYPDTDVFKDELPF